MELAKYLLAYCWTCKKVLSYLAHTPSKWHALQCPECKTLNCVQTKTNSPLKSTLTGIPVRKEKKK